MSKTNPARGMRDFLPDQVRKRDYVIGIIKEVYEKYGFEPLETPAVEDLATLTNKYGEEGDQLMFKILKRGEKLRQELSSGTVENVNDLADLALRYDLTVPLARVVANYRNELPKFFKRYQIQPVWRADRPARGRFREFYQCDADAIGSKSMIVEAELLVAVSEILERLGFKDYMIKLNHRKILTGVLENSGIENDLGPDAIAAVDKIDKIGIDAVIKEFETKGISLDNVLEFLKFIKNVFIKRLEGLDKNRRHEANQTVITMISSLIRNHKVGNEGLIDLANIMSFLEERSDFLADPLLARGLSYYTGAIFEVVLTKGDFTGSIAGGGRYDGLIGMFGKEEIPAVGISLGLERILMIMEERGMFPEDLPSNAADVLVTIWSEETASESLKLAAELRTQGLRVLVYPEADKLGKQFKYADQVNVEYVCVLGETELAENTVSLKNMKTGKQEVVSRGEIFAKVS